MEIRQLKTNDVFKMSKILKKIGVKVNPQSDEIDPKTGKRKDKTVEQLGGELMLQIVENMHLAQDEINDFMGGLVGLTKEQFGELPIDKTFEVIGQFKNIPGFISFFKAAGQLTK